MKNETETMTTTTTTTRLTGDALLDRIQVVIENSNVLKIEATASAKAYACGYIKENGQPDFVPFYEALIEAKGLNEPTEDPEMSELEADLRERFSDEAVDAFIDIWSVDDLEGFEDAYQGEYGSGAAYAEELVTDSFGIDNLPTFVALDWEATWDNLRYDYHEQDGFIFNANW
jgi:hypothetical protein